MATISIISNDGALDSSSAVLEVTATNPEYNQPALRIKQAGRLGGAARSGSMTRIPTLSLSKPIRWLQRGNMRLPFSQISSRSMAAMLPTMISTPLSYFKGRLRVAISVSDSRKPKTLKSLEEDRVSSRSLMLPPPPTDNLAGAGILYVQDGALTYRSPNGFVTVIAKAKEIEEVKDE